MNASRPVSILLIDPHPDIGFARPGAATKKSTILMLSLLPFLLIGLGLSLFVGDDDDGEETSSDQDLDQGIGGVAGSGGDLLDFVEGIELGVVQEPSIGDQTGESTYIDTPLTGGEGDDTITGGVNDDTLSGAGGNDLITGDLGADVLFGNDGDDTIDGGGGDDTIVGGDGADSIDGGAGDDNIVGVDGADTLFGGDGNDTLTATTKDLAPFGPIIDPAFEPEPEAPAEIPDPVGGSLDAPVPDDLIPTPEPLSPTSPVAPTEGQVLFGGAGDDVLIGDTGDTLSGGEGVDSFMVDTAYDAVLGTVLITDFDPTLETLTLNVDGLEAGDPTQDGFGFEIETRDLADASGLEVLVQGVVVATLSGVSESDELSISVVASNSGAANPGTFANFGDGDDTASGDLSDDTLNGGDGNDSLDGSAGRDVLNGEAGDDTLNGGAGRDDLSGGDGNDLLNGGGNDETPVSTVVQERLDGGAGDDTLQTGDGYVALTGGEGTDTFEITRTEIPADAETPQFGNPVTEITDFDVATEEVNITFVNGDASGAVVPFTLVDAPDESGVAIFIGGQFYAFLSGVLAADAPTVNVTSAA